MKYIIEHLEPRLYKWSLVEYNHISDMVGKKDLIFTNIKNLKNKKILSRIGKVYSKSIRELNFKKLCILDPLAKKTLTPKDCKKFKYLVFGGILGNEPMEGRTKRELSQKIKAESRNLGKKQMATDTAVYAAKMISQGRKFGTIRFQDELEIDIREGESILLPFRYVLEENKPVLARNFAEFLRKRKGF